MSETALLLSRKAAEVLAERGIDQSRLDAELLLAHVLGISRLQLYLQHDRPLTDEELARFRSLIRRRLKREPVQYLVGTAHFRELELTVDPRVLIPRPETEELVGRVLDWAWQQVGGKPRKRHAEAPAAAPLAGGTAEQREGETAAVRDGADGEKDDNEGEVGEAALAVSPSQAGQGGEVVPPPPPRRLVALDLCTGSGAIALSLLKEGPFDRVVATDLSEDALVVAGENAERLGMADRIDLRLGSLWEPVGQGERFDVVVSNPPYVAERERAALAPEVAAWEPAGALFAGEEGFAVIEPIVAAAPAHLRDGGLLALEIGAAQAQGVLKRLEAGGAFRAARVLRDMAGRDRVALAESHSLAPEGKRGDHA